MAMSDCPKCWDTPCTCGHMGYQVVDGTCKDCVYYRKESDHCVNFDDYLGVHKDWFCADFERKT